MVFVVQHFVIFYHLFSEYSKKKKEHERLQKLLHYVQDDKTMKVQNENHISSSFVYFR